MHSVLSPGVSVLPGAVVRNSIVMNDTVVGADAVLDRAVVDKQVVIGAGARVGARLTGGVPNVACPDHLSSGLVVVGKGAHLPAGVQVGRNARIGSHVEERDIGDDVPAGGVVYGPGAEHGERERVRLES